MPCGDGLELNVVCHGTGKPLVLVHGFPLDHTMWKHQIDDLSDTCRVIAVDLRGFGKNAAFTDSVLSMQQLADDVANVLDALKMDEPITYCGLSMGGYVGWQFWQRHRDRLGKLIICDSRALPDEPMQAKTRLKAADFVLEHGPAGLVETMMPKLFAASSTQRDPEMVATLKATMLSTPATTIAAAQRGMAARPDMTGELSKIDVPTQIICGELDEISTAEEMRAIAAAIPDADYVEIAGVGHMTPLEATAEVNVAIRNFL